MRGLVGLRGFWRVDLSETEGSSDVGDLICVGIDAREGPFGLWEEDAVGLLPRTTSITVSSA